MLIGIASHWSLGQDLSVFIAFCASIPLVILFMKWKVPAKFILFSVILVGVLIGVLFTI